MQVKVIMKCNPLEFQSSRHKSTQKDQDNVSLQQIKDHYKVYQRQRHTENNQSCLPIRYKNVCEVVSFPVSPLITLQKHYSDLGTLF